MEVDYKKINMECYSVIAAISNQHGILHWKYTGKSAKIPDFVNFLKEIRSKLKNQPTSIFLDNLNVHHAKITKDEAYHLGFDLIFNISYSPDYNPIEFVFSKVKQHFKNAKTRSIVNN